MEERKKIYCSKCGSEIQEGANVCSNCHYPIEDHYNQNDIKPETNKNTKFLPSFILGLIGSIFGIFGGLCTTMCNSLYSTGTAPFVLIVGGSIVGLIGACECLKNVKIGALLEIVAAVMIIICAYGPTGADFQTVIAMLMFAFGGIIGIIRGFFIKK